MTHTCFDYCFMFHHHNIHDILCLRSLGVTIWELFELGNQPYRHYSDRQVLTYAVREQQLRLPKPMLKVPLAERW